MWIAYINGVMGRCTIGIKGNIGVGTAEISGKRRLDMRVRDGRVGR